MDPSMKYLFTALLFIAPVSANAETVFKIEIGKDYKKYSHSDLQSRVWELERAVWQLQQKVFQLENKTGNDGSSVSWLCTVEAMGTTYTGTGLSKSEAKQKAIDSCKAARGGDGFFCKEAKCEQ
jgi:hypothetical protein